MPLPTDSVSSFRDGFACQPYRKRRITRSDFLPAGNQMFSVTTRNRKKPNYTFWVRWAKNPIFATELILSLFRDKVRNPSLFGKQKV